MESKGPRVFFVVQMQNVGTYSRSARILCPFLFLGGNGGSFGNNLVGCSFKGTHIFPLIMAN